MESINQSQKVFSCCRKGQNCPKVKKIGNEFFIEDDFGGNVRMTEEQFSILREAEDFFRDEN